MLSYYSLSVESCFTFVLELSIDGLKLLCWCFEAWAFLFSTQKHILSFVLYWNVPLPI